LGYDITLDPRLIAGEEWALENISADISRPINVAAEGFGGIQLLTDVTSK